MPNQWSHCPGVIVARTHSATQPLQFHTCMGCNPIMSGAPYWFVGDSLRGNHSNRCLIEQTRPHGTVELRGCLFGSLSLQMTMQIRRETPSVSSWKRKTNCSLLYFLSHAKTFCCSQPVAASLPGMPLHCHRKSEQRQTSLFVTTHHFSHYNTYSVSSILLPPQGLPWA